MHRLVWLCVILLSACVSADVDTRRTLLAEQEIALAISGRTFDVDYGANELGLPRVRRESYCNGIVTTASTLSRVSRHDQQYTISGENLCFQTDAGPQCRRLYRDDQGQLYVQFVQGASELSGLLPMMPISDASSTCATRLDGQAQ